MWDFSEKGEMNWEYVRYVKILRHSQSSSLGHVRYAQMLRTCEICKVSGSKAKYKVKLYMCEICGKFKPKKFAQACYLSEMLILNG